jgi:hypothetical protein
MDTYYCISQILEHVSVLTEPSLSREMQHPCTILENFTLMKVYAGIVTGCFNSLEIVMFYI